MRVKICGLTDRETVAAAANAGAYYLGFVLYPNSPRALTMSAARDLMLSAPAGVVRVALLVNPDDDEIDQVARLPLEMIQLHGGEPPERVAEIRKRAGRAVMKAIGVREKNDLLNIEPFAAVADQLLIDAKPPIGATRPGGNAESFDWDLLAGRRWTKPWLLAGGLTEDNVRLAIRKTGATQVDVSSGVESEPGVKSRVKIEAFIRAAG